MADINRIELIGHVGDTPIIRTKKDGNKVANFSIATNDSYKTKDDERMTEVEWHSVVVFNKHFVRLVEKYVEKGFRVRVEGKKKTHAYTDKNGFKRKECEIVVSQFFGRVDIMNDYGKRRDDEEDSQPEYPEPFPSFNEPFDDEMPF